MHALLRRPQRPLGIAVASSVIAVLGGAAFAAPAQAATHTGAHAASPLVKTGVVVGDSATRTATGTVRTTRITAAALAAPQGVVAPTGTGCTASAGALACDLFAMKGSTTIDGPVVPIWGFSPTGAAASATLPGPVLVANAGDTITVTLHNVDIPSAVSLAIPTIDSTATDDTVGITAGNSKVYTFTAARPGTYLYEAGHTTQGAREAAAGLVGGLIVRPAAAATYAYANTASDQWAQADSTFDDESLLVLSEIDTRLQADPLNFDLRSYSPTYRLINGKSYPETDPIATTAGHKVLVRYVNAGIQPHSMGSLGVTQTVVGEGARPDPDAIPVVADTVAPGATEDVVVTVPTPTATDLEGTKFALYETAGHLFTGSVAGSKNYGTTNQVATGGMMTFLDTGAAAAGPDNMGPATTSLSISSSLVKATDANPTVTASFSDVATGGSNVDAAVYSVDNGSADPSTLGSQAFAGAFGSPTVTGATATVPVAGLAQGLHTIYVWAHDSSGNWGPPKSITVTVASSGAQTTSLSLAPGVTNGSASVTLTGTGDDTVLGGTVDSFTYAIDGGTGTTVPITSPATIVPLSTTFSVTALGEGNHTISVSSHDSLGFQGPAATITLTIDKTGPTMSGGITSPTNTNGTVGDVLDPTQMKVSASFTDTTSGGVASGVVTAEGLLADTAPTAAQNGTGFLFVANACGAWAAGGSCADQPYGLVAMTQLTQLSNGTHYVFVHARDAAGNWGPWTSISFVVDRLAPTMVLTTTQPTATNPAFTVTVTANGTGTAIQRVEWFQGTDPGLGLATTAINGANPLSANGWTTGPHVLSFRALDAAGNWSPVSTVTINVPTVAASTFSTGSQPFTLTGTATTTTPNGQTTIAGANSLWASAPSEYGQLAIPATGSVHVSFQFAPKTLTTTGTTSYVTIFTASGTNDVISVQYRVNGAARQIRLAVTNGSGTTFGAWQNLAGNANTATSIRVDWSNTSSAVTLRIGAASTTVSRSTAGLTVTTLRLGVVSVTGTGSGRAAFDTWSSSPFYVLP